MTVQDEIDRMYPATNARTVAVASDLRVGDYIVLLGQVAAVTVNEYEVTITVNFQGVARVLRLAPGSPLWIDRYANGRMV